MSSQAFKIAVVRTKDMRGFDVRVGGVGIPGLSAQSKPWVSSRTYNDCVDLATVGHAFIVQTVLQLVRQDLEVVQLPF